MNPNTPNIGDAILSIRPSAAFIVRDEDISKIEWSIDELDIPSEDEILNALDQLRLKYENLEYQRKRASSYPSIADQLDTLYHKGYDGWKQMIDEVKSLYPKSDGK
jgi:hypothetical protein